MSTADSIRKAAAAQIAAAHPDLEAKPAMSQEETVAALQRQLALAMEKISELAPKPPVPVGMRRYFSRAPFCNFHVMVSPGNCKTYQFIAGSFETDDPVVQKYLDEAAALQDSAISTSNIYGHVRQEQVEMQQDMAQLAGRSHARMLAAGLPTG